MSLAAMSDLQQGFTGITLLTALFLIAGFITIAANRSIGRDERHIFMQVIVVIISINIIDWITFVTNGTHPELRQSHVVLTAVMFSLAPTLPPAIARAIFPDKRPDIAIGALLAVHAVIQVVNIFGGFIFWVDETNTYHRGSFYFIYVIVVAISGIYLVVQSIRAGRMYQSRNAVNIISILMCMMFGIAIQVLFPNIHTSWAAVAMALVLFFAYYSDMLMRCDGLTNLLSRHSFDEFVDNPKLPCSIIIIDVDDFKKVNDTYGHSYGDHVLVLIARLIRTAYKNIGTCYRTGGDEFCVIVTKRFEWTDESASTLHDLLVAERARDPRIPSISIGAPTTVTERDGFDAAIEDADRAMYSVKQAAKGGRGV